MSSNRHQASSLITGSGPQWTSFLVFFQTNYERNFIKGDRKNANLLIEHNLRLDFLLLANRLQHDVVIWLVYAPWMYFMLSLLISSATSWWISFPINHMKICGHYSGLNSLRKNSKLQIYKTKVTSLMTYGAEIRKFKCKIKTIIVINSFRMSINAWSNTRADRTKTKQILSIFKIKILRNIQRNTLFNMIHNI